MGLSADAIAAAKKAVEADPRGTFGSRTEAIIDERRTDPFVEAKALAASGLDAEAAKSANEALHAHPGRTLPPELSYLNGQLLRDFWSPDRWITKLVVLGTNIGSFSALVVLAIGWVTAALLITIGIVRPMLRRMTSLRFDVQVSESPGVEGVSSDGVPKLGGSLAVAVESELQALRAEGGSASLDLQRGPDGEIPIPESVKELGGHAGLIAALLKLLPNRLFTLVLTMHPRGTQGVGLTAAIVEPAGSIQALQTFWESDLDGSYRLPKGEEAEIAIANAEAYQTLGLAAASWAIYQRPVIGERTPLISRYWQSYVYHRVGAKWQDLEEGLRARSLYLKALEKDPQNWGALLNLAYLDWDDAERAIELLREAERLTRRDRADSPTDRSWFRIRYSLGVRLIHRALEEPASAGKTEWLQSAERLLIRVIAAADATLAPSTPRAPTRGLRSLMQRARETARAMRARWLIRQALEEPSDADREKLLRTADEQLTRMIDDTGLPLREPSPAGSDLTAFLELAREASATALVLAWQKMAGDTSPPLGLPPSFASVEPRDPDTLIAALERVAARAKTNDSSRTALRPTSRYNLSNYFAGKGEPGYAAALRELRFGLAPGEAKSTRDDPALQELQNSPKYRAEFDTVLEKYASTSPSPGSEKTLFERLRLTKNFADALKGKGIETPEELELWTRSPEQRQSLADTLGVSAGLLEQWGDLLRLRILYGATIDLRIAELLFDSGIRHREALTTRTDAAVLLADLTAMNKARAVEDQVPAEQLPKLADVSAWLRAARDPKPISASSRA